MLWNLRYNKDEILSGYQAIFAEDPGDGGSS